MATTTLTPAASTYRSGLYEWLTTTDHKKIGILYLVNSFIFFFLGGLLALLVRTELARPGLQFLHDELLYNQLFTMHGTVMIFLFIIPMLVGLRELRRAAPDRRAGHGVPADQRPVVLDAAAGRLLLLLGLPDRRRGRSRLDELRAAVRGPASSRRPGPGQDLWIMGARPDRDELDPGRDQLPRDDLQDARARA